MRIICFCLILLCTYYDSSGQKRSFSPIKVYASHSLGWNTSVGTPPLLSQADNLSDPRSTELFLKAIDLGVFFGNWGVKTSMTVVPLINETVGTRYSRLENEVKLRYGDSYYIDSKGILHDSEQSSPAIMMPSVGVMYKVEKGRWCFIMNGEAGFSVVPEFEGAADLKEIGSNERLAVIWKKNREVSFLISPSATLGFRVSKKFMLSLNMNHWRYNTRPKYITEIINQDSGDITFNKSAGFKNRERYYAAGLGLIFILWQ